MIVLTPHVSRIIAIFLAALVIWVVMTFLTRGFAADISAGVARAKKLRTVTGIIRATVSTVIVVIALVMILREIGFDITPLLTSAGIVGLALGFGAQSLVKDVIAGFFLIIENQFDEGDEIEVSGEKGVVQKITLRTVWLKDNSGVLHIIPNGSIVVVKNFSKSKG
jgi:small-conductance mechanosensitive channel